MSTIYILWLRQVKRYLRSPARIIGSIGQPLLFFLALGFGFGPVFSKAGGGNYLEFIGPGVIAMSILFTAVFSGMEMIWDRQFGFLKETFVAPVSRIHIVLGRVIGGGTVATLQGVLILVLIFLFGFRPTNWLYLPFAFVIMAVISTIFSAFGTALASILDDMQGFQLIMNFVVMPTFFFSGSLFPLNGLPPALVLVAKLDPLTYGVDALRGFLVGNNHLPIIMSSGILFSIMAVFVVAATVLFSRMEL